MTASGPITNIPVTTPTQPRSLEQIGQQVDHIAQIIEKIQTERTNDNNKLPETQTTIQSQKNHNANDKTILGAFYDGLLKFVPIKGEIIASLFHIWACIHHLLSPKDNNRGNSDRLALNVSKVTLVTNCALQGIEALKKNRFIEAFSRFIEPIFILAEKRVEDLGLARGIGLGISQLVGSQEGIFNELAKQKLGIDVTVKDGPKPSMGQDFDLNFNAMTKIFKENIIGGFGNERRFLTGFTWENIQKQLKEFKERFNLSAIKDLFDTKHGDYRDRFEVFLKTSGLSTIKELFGGDKKRDKGHTDALSGYLMILGSILGYMDKAGKGLCYKIGGTLRNTGGAVADIGLFAHEDPDPNIAAMFLSVNTVMDMLQRFIPSKMLNLILPWSNFSMAAYNIGVSIYLNRSSKKTNKGENIKYHDTDLQKATAIKLAQPTAHTDKQYAQVA